MRIAICDDSRDDALSLTPYLDEHRVSIFLSALELLDDLTDNGGRYDLYLLDIYIGADAKGIELAKSIREIDGDADICFISSSDEFYRQAYDLQNVNYLLKPLKPEDFISLIERYARRNAKNRQQSFSYKWNGHMESVPYANILYIGSSGHMLDIYCKDGGVKQCKAKLGDIEPMLDTQIFIRCHQSFIVNLYQVDHLTGSDLMMGKHQIPISRRYFADVKRRYREMLFEEVY